MVTPAQRIRTDLLTPERVEYPDNLVDALDLISRMESMLRAHGFLTTGEDGIRLALASVLESRERLSYAVSEGALGLADEVREKEMQMAELKRDVRSAKTKSMRWEQRALLPASYEQMARWAEEDKEQANA